MYGLLHPAPVESECILSFTVIGQLQDLPCQSPTSHETTERIFCALNYHNSRS